MLSNGLGFFLGLEGKLYKRLLGYEPVFCCNPSLLETNRAKQINHFRDFELAYIVPVMTEFSHKTAKELKPVI